jgi:hypothetical protein
VRRLFPVRPERAQLALLRERALARRSLVIVDSHRRAA